MSGLIIRSDNEKALNRDEFEQLNSLFEESEKALKQTEKSFKEQEAYLESGKGGKLTLLFLRLPERKIKSFY